MVLEGIVTSINDDGTTNVSPMGPLVDDESFASFILRPFNTSTTYRNLKRTGHGVLHVTDDVLLLAKAAVGTVSPEPDILPDTPSTRRVLANCCHWYAFDVVDLDDSAERTAIQCQIVDQGRVRNFFGFNRAKHAVLEAAILATRLHLLPHDEVQKQFSELRVLIDKTAGDREVRAFDFLQSHVDSYRKQHTQ